MVSAWSTNRHAAVVGLTPQTKRYEKDFALERGVARIMSAPAKSYALAVGLVQRRLDALPIDFQLPRARLARHLDRIAHDDAELGEGEIDSHAVPGIDRTIARGCHRGRE